MQKSKITKRLLMADLAKLTKITWLLKKIHFDYLKLIRILFFLSLTSGLNLLIFHFVEYRSIGMIYLIALSLMAKYLDYISIFITAILSTLLWNFLFIPPRFTFHTYSHEDFIMLLTFFVVALVLGSSIKKLKEKDNTLKKMNSLLLEQESQKITKAILSSVSHELRTPLSTIKGYATALLNPLIMQNENNMHEVCAEIITGVERLDRVVQNLLDMSRIESGNMKIKHDLIDPIELISGAISKNRTDYPNIKIHFEHDQSLGFLDGDYLLLQQCIENILRNSSIYSRTDILCSFKTTNHQALIEISDSGPGIKCISKLFEKFYRETPQIPGGLGLGLSICKSIIEIHRGKIDAQNLTSCGVKFSITLPIKEPYGSY